jgi:hypothetical protein
MTRKQPRWRLGTADFSPVITPSPGIEWTVTRSAQEEMLWIPFEYCKLTVWPISENFLEKKRRRKKNPAHINISESNLGQYLYIYHLKS